MEFTAICRDVTGRDVPIAQKDVTSSVDVPWYITDHANVSNLLQWSPRHDPRQIAVDVLAWIRENESVLANVIV